MNKWLFKILVVPLLYLISILPFFILYRISDLLFLAVYYLAGYRKDVVRSNLRNSFPEKSEAERKQIARQFYLHFCDVMVETIKLLTISRSEFRKRCRMTDEAVRDFNYFFQKNQSIVGVMGHCGNWEWGAISHQVYFERMITGVYHPLHNKVVDKFVKDLRSRFGGDVTPMKELYKRLLFLRNNNIPTTIGLIADQGAPPESAYWTTFLHQETSVFNGAEKLARKFNYPVMYLNIFKEKRGYYTLSTTILTESPNDLPENMISELHTRHLESNIRKQPYTWLWTHRRWKHKRRS